MLRQQNKTRAPIRRQSRARGQCEGALWAPTSRRELSEVVRACERAEFAAWLARDPSRGVGRLGLRVLRELAALTCFRTGRCEPTYATLAMRLGVARSSVAAALARLKRAGWLRWMRRVERNPDDADRRWRQTSNAWALALPRAVAAILRLPMPAEVEDARRARAQLRADYERQADPHGDALASALARLRRAMDADCCEAGA